MISIYHMLFMRLSAIIFALLIIASSSFSQMGIRFNGNEIIHLYYALKASGEESLKKGKYEDAVNLFRQALILSRESEQRNEEIACYMSLGLLYWNLGQLNESLDHYDRAHSLAKKFNLLAEKHESMIFMKIFNLYKEGKKYRSSGQYQESVRSFQKAIHLAKKIKSREHEVKCLRQLSITYWNLNDLNQFFSLNEKALKIAQFINHKKEEARCLINIGVYYFKKDNYSKALHYYQAALKIIQELSDNKNEESILITNISMIYNYIGDYDETLSYLKRALAIDHQIKNNHYICKDLNIIGWTYRIKGQKTGNKEDLYNALDYFLKCLRLAKEIKDDKTEIEVINNIGTVYSDLKEHDKALHYFQIGYEKAEKANDVEALGMILNNMGIV
ncbi:MAG: tetratricopeptide repeat protein, partial [Candidatus Aminicenantales bacterium]